VATTIDGRPIPGVTFRSTQDHPGLVNFANAGANLKLPDNDNSSLLRVPVKEGSVPSTNFQSEFKGALDKAHKAVADPFPANQNMDDAYRTQLEQTLTDQIRLDLRFARERDLRDQMKTVFDAYVQTITTGTRQQDRKDALRKAHKE